MAAQLQIVPPKRLTIDEFFARDRDNIMMASRLSKMGKCSYFRPSRSLRAVADCMDFSVTRVFCRSSYVDKASREIVITTQAHTEGAFEWELCLQIAHIRLHLYDGVSCLKESHVREAEHYARVFLAKEADFRKSVESRASIYTLSEIYSLPREQVYLRCKDLGLTPTREMPYGWKKRLQADKLETQAQPEKALSAH